MGVVWQKWAWSPKIFRRAPRAHSFKTPPPSLIPGSAPGFHCSTGQNSTGFQNPWRHDILSFFVALPGPGLNGARLSGHLPTRWSERSTHSAIFRSTAVFRGQLQWIGVGSRFAGGAGQNQQRTLFTVGVQFTLHAHRFTGKFRAKRRENLYTTKIVFCSY